MESDNGFNGLLLGMLQNAIDEDMEEYHQLRRLCEAHPVAESFKLLLNKLEYLKSNFNLTDDELDCLAAEYDKRMESMFYGPSPMGN